MQYELKTKVVEPTRQTYDTVSRRFGNRPGTRYQEGSIDIQPTENFHYRPTWDPTKEIYDHAFSVLRLSDPDAFTDPRQFYYAPYVTSRAQMHDAVASTLQYLEQRDMLGRLPDAWRTFYAEVVLPLRHYESAGQLVFTGAARFAYGSTVTQCADYAAFDRIGNAQIISRLGIALGGGTAELLDQAKTYWMDDPAQQGLRRLAEELIAERDWGVGMVTMDVTDQLLYHLFFAHLDDTALDQGAPAYSLVAQHLKDWFVDHRKWMDALYTAWRNDEEAGAENTRRLDEIVSSGLERAMAALTPLAAAVDAQLGAGAGDALRSKADEIRAAHCGTTEEGK